MIGKTISHYRVLKKSGEGETGVDYRAEDTRLDRTVTLKFVAPELLNNDDSRARFLQEARVAAALDHPNICAIHEIDEADGHTFIAVAHVEGESVEEKRRHGSLTLEEALDIAIQAADGLKAAHEKGVIHRDLNCSNLMVTPQGQVKIMDFGLASLADQTRVTQTLDMTTNYVSPELAQRQPADHRTDIWSLGVVIYEMITGRSPFEGERETPEPMARLRTGVPRELDRIVAKTLARSPDERYPHAEDMLVDLRALRRRFEPKALVSQTVAAAPRRRVLAWALAGVMAVIATVAVWGPWRESTEPEKQVSRFVISLPEGHLLGSSIGPRADTLAISPDGAKIAYGARREGAPKRLYWRRIDEFESREIPGTEEVGGGPFFSPDCNWVGFKTQTELKKVSLLRGSPQTIAKLRAMQSGWGEDGTIIVAGAVPVGLFRVHSDGGELEPITLPEKNFEKGEVRNKYPQILPGGKAVLFTGDRLGGDSRVSVISLETGERKTLLERASQARYVPTGHIVCLRGSRGDLHAVPFDLETLEVTGDSVPVQAGVRTVRMCTEATYSISDSGTLIYVAGGPAGQVRPVWVDRDGKIEPLPFPPDYYLSPRISPDGRWLGITRMFRPSLLLSDLARGTLRPLTDENGKEYWQMWGSDSEHIVFISDRPDGRFLNLYRMKTDGSGETERLTETEASQTPYCWTPDGKALIFGQDGGPSTDWDIWLLPLAGDRQPRPLLNSPAREIHPVLSPDGQWLAYTHGPPGQQLQVYVRSFPDLGQTTQVSIDGGIGPVWRPDGKELFYLSDYFKGDLYGVSFQAEPELKLGQPQALFSLTNPDGSRRFSTGSYNGIGYEISADGKRFLMLQKVQDPPVTRLHVVLNWFEELKRKVPVGN